MEYEMDDLRKKVFGIIDSKKDEESVSILLGEVVSEVDRWLEFIPDEKLVFTAVDGFMSLFEEKVVG